MNAILLSPPIPESDINTVRPGRGNFPVSLSHSVPVNVVEDDSDQPGIHRTLAEHLVGRNICFEADQSPIEDSPESAPAQNQENADATETDNDPALHTAAIDALADGFSAEQLRLKATELGIDVKSNMTRQRLAAAIVAAQNAANPPAPIV